MSDSRYVGAHNTDTITAKFASGGTVSQIDVNERGTVPVNFFSSPSEPKPL